MRNGSAARLRGRPRYIELMGAEAEMDILRIVRESAAGMPASQDLDFSGPSIRANLAAGHAAALRTLRHAKRRQADAG